MSGIRPKVLLNHGYRVQGSDHEVDPRSQTVLVILARLFLKGQQALTSKGPRVIRDLSAIQTGPTPKLVCARVAGCRSLRRAEMLAE